MMTAEQKAAWLSARAGLLTASRMNDAMAFNSDGKPSAARIKYMEDLLTERTGTENAKHHVTDAMLHGVEYEDEAVDVFVERYPQYIVRPSRFYLHPTIEHFGATPDRECGEDGLLEIKCPQPNTYRRWVIDGVVPEKHKNQMIAQCLCSGKTWVGFIAYDPTVREEGHRLFLRKYVPTAEELAKVEQAAITFLQELDLMFDKFVGAW